MVSDMGRKLGSFCGICAPLVWWAGSLSHSVAWSEAY